MSKYTTVATEFRDAQCLIEALHEMGFTDATLHEKAVNLYGYRGDKREQTAEIVVRRSVTGGLGGSSNDLGFKLNAEGNYEALISEYDRGYLNMDKRGKSDFVGTLKGNYARKNTMKTALIQGLRFVQETTNELGEVQLEFAVV